MNVESLIPSAEVQTELRVQEQTIYKTPHH